MSGGERQRLVLARAVLRVLASPVPVTVVLDEATSALDPEGEAACLQFVVDTCKARGATVLMVAHRLALLPSMVDGVVVLEGGRVLEVGPPSELLVAGGAFARMSVAGLKEE